MPYPQVVLAKLMEPSLHTLVNLILSQLVIFLPNVGPTERGLPSQGIVKVNQYIGSFFILTIS